MKHPSDMPTTIFEMRGGANRPISLTMDVMIDVLWTLLFTW